MAISNAAKTSRGPGVPFKPGNPGGPGRHKGSRNKLSEAVLTAIYQDFELHGVAAVTAARDNDPLGYCKMVASLLSTKIDISLVASEMTDEELLAVIRKSATPDQDSELADQTDEPTEPARH